MSGSARKLNRIQEERVLGNAILDTRAVETAFEQKTGGTGPVSFWRWSLPGCGDSKHKRTRSGAGLLRDSKEAPEDGAWGEGGRCRFCHQRGRQARACGVF